MMDEPLNYESRILELLFYKRIYFYENEKSKTYLIDIYDPVSFVMKYGLVITIAMKETNDTSLRTPTNMPPTFWSGFYMEDNFLVRGKEFDIQPQIFKTRAQLTSSNYPRSRCYLIKRDMVERTSQFVYVKRSVPCQQLIRMFLVCQVSTTKNSFSLNVWKRHLILSVSCTGTTFHCSYENICISLIQVCDGKYDCSNGEDERNCSEYFKFQCQSNNQSVPYQNVCDYRYDCNDKSDEIFCDLVKINNALREVKLVIMREIVMIQVMKTVVVINLMEIILLCQSKDIICDFVYDCYDGTDEDSVECDKKFDSILSERYQNVNNYKKKCSLKYNSVGNLDVRVREPFSLIKYCDREKCLKGEYLCQSSRYCISIEQVCDGINHCWYGDDEFNCSEFC
ncbi:DgyrCDS9667 [Dimorphilus gyrociliatus]|uniref:DgyrCDS9667 n=1 Tax=Dimorphilus gyrociliatus TaxID=2664684 RepID=A0A7I8W2Y6_9ANNE|nr:DgyrCDS9667 [Dimorphilus gyrociliatus]